MSDIAITSQGAPVRRADGYLPIADYALLSDCHSAALGRPRGPTGLRRASVAARRPCCPGAFPPPGGFPPPPPPRRPARGQPPPPIRTRPPSAITYRAR